MPNVNVKAHAVLLLASIQLLTSTCIAHGQLPDSLDTFQQEQDVLIYGANELDKTGWALTSGDVNGDGVTDLIVGSSGASPLGRQGIGEIEIFWGGTGLDGVFDLGDSTGGVSRIFGEGPYVGLFMRLTSGDYNGDGYADIAMGLTQKPPFINPDGIVYIIFGRADFPDTLDLRTAPEGVTRIYSVPGSDGWLGIASTSADVDGDGYDDLVVSAPFFYTEGMIYVVFGRESFPDAIFLGGTSTRVTRIVGPTAPEAPGSGLAVGDVNNDGLHDILIGSPAYDTSFAGGKVTLIYGRPAFPDTIDLANAIVGIVRFFPEPNNATSTSLGERERMAISDIDGDGFGDIIVSSPSISPLGCMDCGGLYVVYGNVALQDTIILDSPNIRMTRLFGAGDYNNYGETMLAEDFTGDGYADIVIFNEYRDFTSFDGRNEVIIVYGSGQMPDSLFLATDTTVSRIIGQPRSSKFGHALAAADLNADGVNDLSIGAYRASAFGKRSAGRVYVFNGVLADSPTAVLITAFDLAYTDGTVKIVWEIGHADELQGFNVYRSVQRDRGFARVNETLISTEQKYEYFDDTIEASRTYWYRLGAVDKDGEFFSPTKSVTIPKTSFILYQNYPNPFNPYTMIRYSIKERSYVTLRIYNVAGQLVRTLVDEVKEPVGGAYNVIWDGKSDAGHRVPSGVYIYQLVTPDFKKSKKLVVLK